MNLLHTYSTEMVPRTFECDPKGRLRMNDLLKHFQEAASEHANKLNFGMNWMIKNGYAWVLVDLKLGIGKMPKWREDLTLYTMPSGYDDLRAYREYLVQRGDGDIIVKGTSAWMVLDMRQKVPVPIKDLSLDLPMKGKKNFEDLSRTRMQLFGEPIHRILVAESSIDLNGHVNNTEYARWAMDALSLSEYADMRPKEVHFGYTSEVFKGERVEIFLERNDDHILIGMKAEEREKVAFTMTLKV